MPRFQPPSSPSQALSGARNTIDFRDGWTVDQLIHSYINGPRILSAQSPLRLLVASHNSEEHELIFCMAHWLADGVGCLLMAQDFLKVLGENISDDQLVAKVESVWNSLWGKGIPSLAAVLPCSAEDRLPKPKNKLQAVASLVEAYKHQDRYIVSGILLFEISSP